MSPFTWNISHKEEFFLTHDNPPLGSGLNHLHFDLQKYGKGKGKDNGSHLSD